MIHSRTDRDDQLKYILYTMYVHMCITSALDLICFTPSSSTTKTGRHDIAESGVKHNKSNQI
jgi:hypothetical protein